MRVAVGLIVAAALAGGAAAQTAPERPPREIVVTGEGRVEVAPDMATITGGVETEAATAGEALAATTAAMEAVLAAVAAAGVAADDMQTVHLAVTPVYRQQETGEWTPEVVGYSARNMLQVRVRAVGNLGAVIDAMAGAGANLMEGIAFGID